MAPIRRQLANVWTFREIAAGDDHHKAIGEHLDQAAFGILMISARFLASDYVANVELPKLTKGNSRLFAVIVGHCDHSDITTSVRAVGVAPLNEMSEPSVDRSTPRSPLRSGRRSAPSRRPDPRHMNSGTDTRCEASPAT